MDAAVSATPVPIPVPEAQTHEEHEHEHHHVYIFPRLRRRLPPPSKGRLRAILAGLMVSMVLCGWTEGSVVPLVPSLQKHYNVGNPRTLEEADDG